MISDQLANQAMLPHTLLLQGGHVIDPASGLEGRFDVAFSGDRVAAIEGSIDPASASQVIPVPGSMVVPGLIDPHVHVFHGVGSSVAPDVGGLSRGATTVVDGGSSGAGTFGMFKHIMAANRTRVLAWLNISTIGLADSQLPECLFLPVLDVKRAVAVATDNPSTIVGFKVRLSTYVTGGSCIPALKLALEAGEATGLPIMLHVGDTAEPLGDILPMLRPGDVVSHYLTPRKNGILGPGAAPGATIIPEVRAARERGVLFDLGRGRTQHMGYAQMQAAVESGELPDTLSTDMTGVLASDPYFGMMMAATDFMSFGVRFEELLPRMTANTARLLRRPELGRLRVGGIGDASILKVETGDFSTTDATGWTRHTDKRLVAVGVVRAGVYSALTPPSPRRP